MARPGLPRAVGLTVIALASLPVLYALAFFALFFTTKPITIAGDVRFFSYSWSARDQLVAHRLTTIRRPALVGDGRVGGFVFHAFFPLAYAVLSREGELVGVSDAARIHSCLVSVHAPVGEGIIHANDEEVTVMPRASWWSMGDRRLMVKDPVAIPGKPGP